MGRLSLESCKANNIVLITTKDFIKLYANKNGIVLTYKVLMNRVHKDKVDYVKHGGRYFIAVSSYTLRRGLVPYRKGNKKILFTKYRTANNNSKKRKPVLAKKISAEKRIFGGKRNYW